MKLKNLKLTNFRAFKDFEIAFSSQTTVIIGHNGAGKTSILDSIAICMTHLTGRLLSSTEKYNIDAWFQPHDITNGQNKGKCIITLNSEQFNANQDFTIEVTKERIKAGLSFDIKPDHWFDPLKSELQNNQVTSLPIIVYYNVHRTYPLEESPSKTKKTYNSLVFAYEKSLKLKSPNFKTFEKWYQAQIIEENAYKIKEKDFEIELPSLKYVRKAINKFLSFLQPDTFGEISTKSESTTSPDFQVKSNSYLMIEKNGEIIFINQLSDGERMVIGLVAEISRRLVIANSSQPLDGDGVVLIDEIELHLHPKWQRTIVRALEQTFPKLTFILTSHSPLVLSSLRRDSIKVISESQEIPNSELPDIYTGTSDEVLERLMLAEDSFNPFKEKLIEIDILFNAMKFDDAYDKLIEIKSELNSNPEWLKDYEERIEFAKA